MRIFSLVLLACPGLLMAMGGPAGQVQGTSGGPMNSEWFYDEKGAYAQANQLHQEKKWALAEKKYQELLTLHAGSEYDQNAARLNLAACQMAQRKASDGWEAYDNLADIPKEKQLPELTQKEQKQLEGQVVLVRSDKVGIGDIVHFWQPMIELKKRTGVNVILSVRHFLLKTLQDGAKACGITLVSEKDKQPETTYQTHIVSLMGHLNMPPAALCPERVVFTAPEAALAKVRAQVEPALSQGKVLAAIFLGENRQATLIGGKQLPSDTKRHGRHLTSAAFMLLLKQHPELVFIDCGTKDSKLSVDEDKKERLQPLAGEEQPFDTFIALARIMSQKEGNIVGFGADQGPTNVFARSLDPQAQQYMAFIIPNGGKVGEDTGEYDMRMEGDGAKYRQMLSNCWVYKCETPEKQQEVVERAYTDMRSLTNQ